MNFDIPPGIKLFVKGALAAFGGGAATVAVAHFTDPGHYTVEGLQAAWPLALAGGVVALAAYLKTSPLPQWKWERKGGEERRGKDS